MQKITLDGIFKNSKEICDDVANDLSIRERILKLFMIIVICGGIYGITMGISHSWMQAISSAIKVPLLFTLTLLVCMPTLHFIGLFLGSRVSFFQSLSILLLGIAINCVLLLGFSTISLFFFASGSGYRFSLLMHVAFFMVSGLAGLISVNRSFAYLSSKTEPENGTRRITLLQVWMLLYMFVGTQMAYTLSPFVGREPEFYVLHNSKGNFYSYVWDTITMKFADRLNGDDARDRAQESANVAIHALQQKDFARLTKLMGKEPLRIIRDTFPNRPYDKEIDPEFYAASLLEASEKNEQIVIFNEYDYKSKKQVKKEISFNELYEQSMYDEDYAKVFESARYNEFTRGRENKEALFAEFPRAIFVEFVVEKKNENKKEKGKWKALRLVFSNEGTPHLIAIIHDSSNL